MDVNQSEVVLLKPDQQRRRGILNVIAMYRKKHWNKRYTEGNTSQCVIYMYVCLLTCPSVLVRVILSTVNPSLLYLDVNCKEYCPKDILVLSSTGQNLQKDTCSWNGHDAKCYVNHWMY